MGSKNSYIATLVERHTHYAMLAKVANKETQTVVSGSQPGEEATQRALQVSDLGRGKELADHRRFMLTAVIDVYFCDPQSP